MLFKLLSKKLVVKINKKLLHDILLVLFALGVIGYFTTTLVVIPFISPDPVITTFPDACPKPDNCTRIANTNNREPNVKPPIFNASINQVAQAVLDWASYQTVLYNTSTFFHIRWTMPLTRFRDDVMILLKPTGVNQTTVWIESQSRIGQFDFNTNTNRVNGFLAFLADYNF